MADLKIKLGKRIKELRKSKNITQEKLAEITGMDITSLSKIETGRNYPQPDTIEKLADAFEIDIDKLFTFKNLLSKDDYIESINKNIMFIQNDYEKLKFLHDISSLLV